MIWVCRKCLFTFQRVSEINQCPDCGKKDYITPASKEEQEIFLKLLKELEKEKW